jgi:hypothetical protein
MTNQIPPSSAVTGDAVSNIEADAADSAAPYRRLAAQPHGEGPMMPRASRWIALGLALLYLGSAYALPPGGGGGDGGNDPPTPPVVKCLENTVADFRATPTTTENGGRATLSWSVKPPSWCQLVHGVTVLGQTFGLAGSVDVNPSRTTDYFATIVATGGSRPLGPVKVTVNIPIVHLSPGRELTAQDIAQFDQRWMKQADLQARLNTYEFWLKNRQVHVAWGLADDAAAMVRMFELTHYDKYLDHLRAINDKVLHYRDDQHPGDDFPNPDGNPNPLCINCRPPFVDRIRGKIMPAWGSGILESDYPANGGLTPIDQVISGMYTYGMVAFARIVAEDPSLQNYYGDDAMKYANAAMQTMWAFMPDFESWEMWGKPVGTFMQPAVSPSSSQCEQARDRALQHVNLYGGGTEAEKQERRDHINAAKTDCDDAYVYAGKTLPHNVSLSLLMGFVELLRALDSDFYRTHPQRASDANRTRLAIPRIVALGQRYFVNTLDTSDGLPWQQRYSWKYNGGVPAEKTHTEDTSHANLDLFYLDVLWQGLGRLNATLPADASILLDDTMRQRFANTFLQQIARPREIDTGGNLRSNVEGRAAGDSGKGGPDYYNRSWDGWIHLAAVDPTVYEMCRNVGLRTDATGYSQPYLSVGNHAALLFNKRWQRTPTPPPPPPAQCRAGYKCCEPDADGGCLVCVPRLAQCPDARPIPELRPANK